MQGTGRGAERRWGRHEGSGGNDGILVAGQGVATVAAAAAATRSRAASAAAAQRHAAAAVTAVGLLPRPFVSNHSIGRKLLSFLK